MPSWTMRSWTMPAVLAGGVAAGMLAMAIVQVVDDGPRAADAVPLTRQAAAETPTPRHVTVDATATVSGTPDLLTISMGVQVRADKATDALRQASDRAAQLVQSLKGAGVAAVDLQTADVNVWPQYDNNGRQIVGYQASESVTAKLRDLGKAGAVIDAAAGAVGDQATIGGLSFSIENSGPLYEQARKLAVDQARAQATQLATAAGVSLGTIVSIEQTTTQSSPPIAYAADQAGGAASKAVPIEPGSQSLQLSVRVTYELKA